MRENIPPEEKLLRLIRGKPKQATTKRPSFKRFKLGVHKIIPAAFIISCIYLALSFIYPFMSPKEINLPEASMHKDIVIEPELKEETLPLEYYLESIRGRQLFGNSPLSGTAQPLGGANPDLSKNMNLVGIISGANAQAIIEDRATQKTYYLNKGQFIGDFQVEDIQEGKIVLNQGGRRFELYL